MILLFFISIFCKKFILYLSVCVHFVLWAWYILFTRTYAIELSLFMFLKFFRFFSFLLLFTFYVIQDILFKYFFIYVWNEIPDIQFETLLLIIHFQNEETKRDRYQLVNNIKPIIVFFNALGFLFFCWRDGYHILFLLLIWLVVFRLAIVSDCCRW